MAAVPPFTGLNIPQLATSAALADWLAVPVDALDYYADPSGRHEEHGETAVNHYHYNLLAKKRGGHRLIEAPKQRLKTLQRQILRGILDHVPVHDAAFGFVRGRNCLDAAARHAGEEMVICYDLQNFFPSIRGARILGIFRSLGYPQAVARQLTGLCTTRTPSRIVRRMEQNERLDYCETHLPQGAPTSPALANLVAYRLDLRLAALGSGLGAQYSRYADDLTFSGGRGISGTLLHLVPQILIDEGFVMQAGKKRLMSQATRQLVTGIVVNQHVNTPRKVFDQLKAVIHACGQPDDLRLQDTAFLSRLLGQIGWVETVNPSRGHKLRRLLERAATRHT
ncbi:reverse transcriptase family protein [Yoonia sp. BS5-3]|uniref:RNA-directed DNA polymerase n=1 Tax=Yoonia phaeophyticola TaxID=3137369 RepID=A0ABZ2UYU3_9RHOB